MQGFCTVPGGRLYYEVSGQGYPLVLLHAGIANLRMWDEQVPAFSKDYQTIAYDARTFGQSTSEPVEFSNRQDLFTLLEHLNIKKAHFIGSSRGGSIALDFTLEFPEKVSSLIMVASHPSVFDYHDDTEAEKAYFARDEALSEKRDAGALADLDVEMWVDGPGQKIGRAEQSVRQKIRAMALQHYQDYFAAYSDKEPKFLPLEPPAAQRLTEVKVPTFLITGGLDFSYTAAAASLMLQEIKGAKHVEIPDVAHMVNMEKPEAFNKLVLEFLDKIN